VAQEEIVLQVMIDRLTETGRCYGMEMNVDKLQVIKISRLPFPVQITIDQKQLENVEYFNYSETCLRKTRLRKFPAKEVRIKKQKFSHFIKITFLRNFLLKK
jgi:hypothetical protein